MIAHFCFRKYLTTPYDLGIISYIHYITLEDAMPNISYFKSKSGNLSAKWPGTTSYSSGKARKIGQIYIGLVVDKERGIFWNRSRGYVMFNTESLTFSDAPLELIPARWREVDQAKKNPPVCVDFGNSYFLDQYIRGIGYDKVINSIKFANPDTFYCMLFYYTLEYEANYMASAWFRQNYVRFLFPKANITSQRISDLLAAIGKDEQKREFLIAHIKYVLENTDGDVSVLIDSTGLPNACDIPYTRVSNHDGDINVEFRMIALVQKSTGLPLFYELIPGNIVDISTVQYISSLAREHGCSIQYMIGDAGYCCPSNIEKLILSGIDFMTRINPTYSDYGDEINRHLPDLDDPDTAVRFKNRLVRVSRFSSVIGKNTDTGEDVSGFIYLCRDMQSKANKDSKLFANKDLSKMTTKQIQDLSARFGIFAIVTTRDLATEEILPEYYIRQKIEQFFDFGKNYAKFLPVREHNMETIAGHMLLSFISSFLVCLMNNHLNKLDAHYTAVPAKLVQSETQSDDCLYVEQTESGQNYYYLEQDPAKEILKESPNSVFYELRGQKAHVFDNVIIPCPAIRQAKDIYEAFHLASPVSIALGDGTGKKLEFSNGERNRLTKKYAFSTKCFLSDDEIEAKKKASVIKKLEETAQKEGYIVQKQGAGQAVQDSSSSNEQSDTEGTAPDSPQTVEKPKRKEGGPKAVKTRQLWRERQENKKRKRSWHTNEEGSRAQKTRRQSKEKQHRRKKLNERQETLEGGRNTQKPKQTKQTPRIADILNPSVLQNSVALQALAADNLGRLVMWNLCR